MERPDGPLRVAPRKLTGGRLVPIESKRARCFFVRIQRANNGGGILNTGGTRGAIRYRVAPLQAHSPLVVGRIYISLSGKEELEEERKLRKGSFLSLSSGFSFVPDIFRSAPFG